MIKFKTRIMKIAISGGIKIYFVLDRPTCSVKILWRDKKFN